MNSPPASHTERCGEPRSDWYQQFQVFLILFLIIVAIVVAILMLFGAYRGIRNLLGVYDYHMSDDSWSTSVSRFRLLMTTAFF